MKRSVLCSLAVLAATFVCLKGVDNHSFAKNDKFRTSRNAIPDRYVVVLEDQPETESKSVDHKVERLQEFYPGNTGHIYRDAFKGYSVEMTEEGAKLLSEDPDVKYVEQDAIVWQTDTLSSPGWALDRIDQRGLPLDVSYTYSSSDGTGVNVYVIDSGISPNHETLLGRVNAAYDAVHDNTPIDQCNGHGTGVAGVIGNSSFGVARNVNLYSVRVLPCTGYGAVSDVLAGIDWVTRHAVKPAVANMSLETTFSRTVNDAVSASIRSGVTYVVAAGNDGDDACRYSPSAVQEAIVVGATNSTDQRVAYSNFGTCVDILAPGEGVKTIWNTTPATYTYASGTSFASPFVAGVAATYLQQDPAASPQAIAAEIVANATIGAIANVGEGSANSFVFAVLDGGNLPPVGCGGDPYSGTLSSPGSSEYQSGPGGFSGGSGMYSASLAEPAGADFSISLEKKGKNRSWSLVATGVNGEVLYRGRSGTYRWRIASNSGSGDYSLCSVTP